MGSQWHSSFSHGNFFKEFYEKGCFVGRAYFSAPDIDGKVYFYAGEAMQGERYTVFIDRADCYDLYGHTTDFEGEI